MGLFDVFKDEDKDSDNGGMTEEYRSEDAPSDFQSEPEPAEKTTSYSQPETTGQSQLGIEELMGKRLKLEEAIDYVGGMIKNLKEKRTNLVKTIEDESVDIKNLKEKLTKISQFIQEENQGLEIGRASCRERV